MKKLLIAALLFSFSAPIFAVTDVTEPARRRTSRLDVSGDSAVRLSANASTTVGSYDILIACTSTADCYWDIIDAQTATATATATFTGVTLTAATGWKLKENVSPFWAVVNWGGNLVVRVLEGGR